MGTFRDKSFSWNLTVMMQHVEKTATTIVKREGKTQSRNTRWQASSPLFSAVFDNLFVTGQLALPPYWLAAAFDICTTDVADALAAHAIKQSPNFQIQTAHENWQEVVVSLLRCLPHPDHSSKAISSASLSSSLEWRKSLKDSSSKAGCAEARSENKTPVISNSGDEWRWLRSGVVWTSSWAKLDW